MNINIPDSAGFCFGVDRAVEMVTKLASSGRQVSTLGPIIHNKQVVDEFEKAGVTVVCDPREMEKGRTLVIRSHGVGADVYSFLEQNGIEYVDATCPFVGRIHKIVAEQSESGADIIIAGDGDHPEVIGIKGFCTSPVYTVKNESELDILLSEHPELTDKRVCLVSQTTFDTAEWKKRYVLTVQDHSQVLEE